MSTKAGEVKFDTSATNSCKGVALMLLLWHHLFYLSPEYGLFVNETAKIAKVCVAIFLILSGYGLTESIRAKRTEILAFYKKQLAKLYLNYWLIAVLFVPIGIIFYDRTLDSVFESHKYIKFSIQMIGLHRFIYSEYGYNATWWYMSIIIPLTILSPLINLFTLTRKYCYWFIVICFIPYISIGKGIDLIRYILPFALGSCLSHSNGIVSISSLLNRAGILRFGILGILIILVAIFRQYGMILHGTIIDWLLGLLIISFTFEVITSVNRVKVILVYLGKHLFNIFLFHTFIFLYYWKAVIYSFKYPVMIFTVLLSVCLMVSILIEGIKKYIGFHKIYKKIEDAKIPDSIMMRFPTH